VLIALGDRDAAAPVVAQLRSIGYGNQEFSSLARSAGY
jgi:hypothetical protein